MTGCLPLSLLLYLYGTWAKWDWATGAPLAGGLCRG
jgi:hypothetical protein